MAISTRPYAPRRYLGSRRYTADKVSPVVLHETLVRFLWVFCEPKARNEELHQECHVIADCASVFVFVIVSSPLPRVKPSFSRSSTRSQSSRHRDKTIRQGCALARQVCRSLSQSSENLRSEFRRSNHGVIPLQLQQLQQPQPSPAQTTKRLGSRRLPSAEGSSRARCCTDPQTSA